MAPQVQTDAGEKDRVAKTILPSNEANDAFREYIPSLGNIASIEQYTTNVANPTVTPRPTDGLLVPYYVQIAIYTKSQAQEQTNKRTLTIDNYGDGKSPPTALVVGSKTIETIFLTEPPASNPIPTPAPTSSSATDQTKVDPTTMTKIPNTKTGGAKSSLSSAGATASADVVTSAASTDLTRTPTIEPIITPTTGSGLDSQTDGGDTGPPIPSGNIGGSGRSSKESGLIAATSIFAVLFALTFLALILLWRRRRRPSPSPSSSDLETLPPGAGLNPKKSTRLTTHFVPAIIGGTRTPPPDPLPDFFLSPQDDNSLSRSFSAAYRALSDHCREYYSSSTSWETLPSKLKDELRTAVPKARVLLKATRAEVVTCLLASKIWEQERAGLFLPGGRKPGTLGGVKNPSALNSQAFWDEREAEIERLCGGLLALLLPLAGGGQRDELRKRGLEKCVARIADLSLVVAYQGGSYHVFENASGEPGAASEGGIVGGAVVEKTMEVVGGAGTGGTVEGVVWPGLAKGGEGENVVLEKVRVVTGG